MTKPRWYGIWYGGSGYGHSDSINDVEEFSSLDDAKSKLYERMRNGYGFRQYFAYANREHEQVLCPCVDTDSEIWLYRNVGDYYCVPEYKNGYTDRNIIDLTGYYPDRIVKFGPRGAVIVEYA